MRTGGAGVGGDVEIVGTSGWARFKARGVIIEIDPHYTHPVKVKINGERLKNGEWIMFADEDMDDNYLCRFKWGELRLIAS
jgi:hypothetical protein